MLIVLGNRSLGGCPQGGGRWSWFLQYPLGLKGLGHRVFWLEVLRSSGDRARERARGSDVDILTGLKTGDSYGEG